MRGKTARNKYALLIDLRARELPIPECEYKFHSRRKWRFDFAYPSYMLAIELEGGIFTHGRHTRGVGYLGDMEKYNAAAFLGWTVLRFTHAQVASGLAGRYIEKTLQRHGHI